MGCGASVESEDVGDDDARGPPAEFPPIARPRGGDVPPLPDGAEYGTFKVVTPAGPTTAGRSGSYNAGEMIPVVAPDGQELEVPCPDGYEADGSEFPCKYVPDPEGAEDRPAPEYVGSGAGLPGPGGGSSSSSGRQRAPLRLCNDCGFGTKGHACFKCKSFVPPHQRQIAPSCKSCVFGTKKNECARCGKYPTKFDAILCHSCGFGPSGTDHCAKCGAHCGAFYG